MAATDDYDAIAKVIETYIEGAKTGDVGLMFPIFHEKAQLFGEGPPPGKRWIWTGTPTSRCRRRSR